MLILTIFLIALTLLITKIILRFRYEFKYFGLFIVTILQKRNFKIAKTCEEIKETLLLSDKGIGIEELIATPAWLPILSIESVNGQKWIELKKNYLIFQTNLPSVKELGSVTNFEVNKFLDLNRNSTVDSKKITILTLKIFLNWLFIDSNLEIDEEMLEKIYESGLEYRKEIAFKGIGCPKKKQESIDVIIRLLKTSERYKNVFQDWNQPECFSVVMQPFIISPMINVSDIAVSIQKYKSNYNEDINLFIDYCILMAHPFPILERYDSKTNSQIFIILNEFKESDKFNYGYGPRACLGRLYAKEFLNEFFKEILNCNFVNFKPNLNHCYSGRDNDNGNFKESIYQVKCFFKMCTKLIKQNFLKNF
jgi:hypothetical protein